MHLLHLVIIKCIIYVRSNHLHLLPIYLWYLPIYVSHLSKGKESTNICKIGYQSFLLFNILFSSMLYEKMFIFIKLASFHVLTYDGGMVCTLTCPLNLSCVLYNFICGSSNLARISPFLNCKPSFMCVHNPLTQWVFNFCDVPMNEGLEMHVVVCDTSIILQVNFHVVQEQLHMLPFVTIWLLSLVSWHHPFQRWGLDLN